MTSKMKYYNRMMCTQILQIKTNSSVQYVIHGLVKNQLFVLNADMILNIHNQWKDICLIKQMKTNVRIVLQRFPLMILNARIVVIN